MSKYKKILVKQTSTRLVIIAISAIIIFEVVNNQLKEVNYLG